MSNVARLLSADIVSQEMGRVVAAEGGTFRIQMRSSELVAKRATSCLLDPSVEDLVLVAVVAGGPSYVLSILERLPSAKATLRVDGDLELALPDGRFSVAAQEGIDLLSGKTVSVAASAIDVKASAGRVVLETLSYLGGAVRAEVEKVKVVAGALDSVMDRWSQKVKRVYRTVEETEQLRAERIDYSAKSTMSLHAENAIVTAEELVKIDGEQIHLG